MIRTDISSQYKTKYCKKYLANGYCPYGQRCLFIHDQKEAHKQPPITPKAVIEKLEISPIHEETQISKATTEKQVRNK